MTASQHPAQTKALPLEGASVFGVSHCQSVRMRIHARCATQGAVAVLATLHSLVNAVELLHVAGETIANALSIDFTFLWKPIHKVRSSLLYFCNLFTAPAPRCCLDVLGPVQPILVPCFICSLS